MTEELTQRLFLVLPVHADQTDLSARLEAALAGGDIACVLFENPDQLPTEAYQELISGPVAVAQSAGAAAMVHNDTRATGRLDADGVHVDTGLADLKLAVEAFSPQKIVGCGGISNRHEAMQLAEAGIDYILFGHLNLTEREAPHPKSITFGDWWAELFDTPCVVMAGASIDGVGEAAATGAEFIGLRSTVWDNKDGPTEAISKANRILVESPGEIV